MGQLSRQKIVEEGGRVIPGLRQVYLLKKRLDVFIMLLVGQMHEISTIFNSQDFVDIQPPSRIHGGDN